MPKIGLSRPYVALYNDNTGTVTYHGGRRMGRAVEFSTEIESSDGNDFSADNAVAETVAGVFTRGTLTMTTAELERDVTKMILGIKTGAITIDGQSITETIFDEDASPPNLGFGVIIKNIIRGITSWTAIVLKKVAFSVPGEDATTQGDEIEWQTTETSATIMRDDGLKHEWQVRAENLQSESLADKYIRAKLNMADTDTGILLVTSVAGTQMGHTKITVEPTLVSGNKYMYAVGANLQVPYYDQTVDEDDGFTIWDGTTDIDVGESPTILIVEVTADNNARSAGTAKTVTAEVPIG